MSWDYLDLADYLLIAEAVLDIPAEDIAKAARLELAESALHAPAAEFGGVEFYADLPSKAAVLCSRLVRKPPAARWQQTRRLHQHAQVRRTQRRTVDLPAQRSRG